MTPFPPRNNPDVFCRKRYAMLARECRRQGLDPRKVERSARELSHRVDRMYYLKGAAYEPTAIALGCPLPDKRVTRRLWWLSQLVDRFLATLCHGRGPTFAFVPPDWYHVTFANRSHFDFTDITMINENEKRVLQAAISQVVGGPVVLHMNGLLLTASGRLFVPGFPIDDRFYELRARLLDDLPQLRVNIPSTAHVKLGHVLTSLKADEVEGLLRYVALCGEHVSARVVFRDAYTPAGRIAL